MTGPGPTAPDGPAERSRRVPVIARIEPILTEHTFRELVFSDLQRIRPRSRPSWLGVLLVIPAHPGMLASLILRTQQVLVRRGHWRLAWMTRSLSVFLTGADIAPGAHVGLGVYLVHPVGVCLGYGSNLGDNITIASGVVVGVRGDVDEDEETPFSPVATVGDGVWLGAHAVLLGGVKVGNNVMIGANTVVVGDVPDNAVMLGVPARRVGTRPEPGAEELEG